MSRHSLQAWKHPACKHSFTCTALATVMAFGVPAAGKSRPAVPPPPASLLAPPPPKGGVPGGDVPPIPSLGAGRAPPPPKKAGAALMSLSGQSYGDYTFHLRGQKAGPAKAPMIRGKGSATQPRSTTSDTLSAANLYLIPLKNKNAEVLARIDGTQFNEQVLDTLSNEDATDAHPCNAASGKFVFH